MEGKQGRKLTRNERKRKRMASGAVSLSQLSPGISDESYAEMNAEMNGTEGVANEGKTVEGVSLSNPTELWKFLRENCGVMIEKIMSSNEWKDSMQSHEDSILALSEENRDLKTRLAIAEGALTRCETAINKLEVRVTDLTTRSMRENIIIMNIQEQDKDKDTDIEEKLLNTFKAELSIPDQEMNTITIERAHRLGKYTQGRTRNIVAKLNTKGKTVIMRHLKNLNREKDVKITEQYPPQVHANREKLWSRFIEAKQQNKPTRWNVDKLSIDGHVINPIKDSNKDINIDTVEEAMKLPEVKHGALKTKNNSHFQAHTVEISSPDHVIPAMKAMCADTRIAGATHVSYAYRIGTERYHHSNWEDDGEWGAGKRIMEALNSTNSYNLLVCVTGWYGSQLIGPSRFDIIKEVATGAIQSTQFLA
jgi:SOS-response transcriptional repressor LexA